MIRAGSIDDIVAGSIAVVGVPWDEHSSFLRGAAAGPRRIREALSSGSTNLWTESGIDLGHEERIIDVGDIEIEGRSDAADEIGRAVTAILRRGANVLALGGDHAVTYPLLKAHSRFRPRLTVLHLDAHPDLYEEFAHDPLSHASPFARVMAEGIVAKLVQLGVRTLNDVQSGEAFWCGDHRDERLGQQDDSSS